MQTGSAQSVQRSHVFAFAGDVPLFHAAWLFAVGVLITHFAWLRPGPLFMSMLVLAVLCAFAARQDASTSRTPAVAMALLWCLLGVWCAEMQPQPAAAPQLLSLSDGLLRTVEGTLVDVGPVRGESEQNVGESPQQAFSQRIDLRLSSIEVVTDAADVQAPTGGGVRL